MKQAYRPTLCLAGFTTLSLIFFSTARASRPAQTTNLNDVTACNGAVTSFTLEPSIDYRSREGSERSERAQAVFDNPSLRSACNSGTRRFANEDAAQALVSADILSRTKKAVLDRVESTRKELAQKQKCLSEGKFSEAADCHFILETQRQMMLMRLNLALSKLPWTCVGDASRASAISPGPVEAVDESIVTKCIDKIQLAHEHPLLSEKSSAFSAIQPLTAEEKNILSTMVAAELAQYRKDRGDRESNLANSSRFRDYFTSLARVANIAYMTKIAENPLLRFIEGPSSTASQWSASIVRADQALQDVTQDLAKQPLREFNRFPWAMKEALSAVPAQFKGDYCEVSNHLLEERKILIRGAQFLKTAGLIGLGLLSGGEGPALLVTSGLTAGAAGVEWAVRSGTYEKTMKECVAQGACQATDLITAKSLVKLDYMALASFGLGAGFRAISSLLARNPQLVERLNQLPNDGRLDAMKKIQSLAGKCE
jgi:hypothetical protein